ncbi:MAG TPA: sulfatase [Myxococcota bacterium]|nr:sulfatase [Myxococcota bacterium]
MAKASAPGKNPFNVIIITSDAMRGDMLGVSGNRQVKTPNLDTLAAAGAYFERAYCNITTTTPSHATLFSSLYPFDHKSYSNTGRISDKIVTLFEVLRDAGWHTAAIVNFAWLNPEVSNIVQGVDELARCVHVRKADKTNEWVFSYLDSRKSAPEPFFLWIHFGDTHTPYHAPGKYERMYYPEGKNPRAGKSGSLQKIWHLFPEHLRDNKYTKRWLGGITDADYVLATNKGSVSWIDEQVGRLIEHLKANGQWKSTLFMFTSDHGESLGEHGLWFVHGGLFEPTARIPLIIRVPGGPTGRKVDVPVSLVDMMPTLLARLGVQSPAGVRGEDVWELLDGKEHPGRVVFLEHAGGYLNAIVTSRYKYIKHRKTKNIYPSYPMRKGTEELYDLAADPGEKTNIAAKNPELLAKMRKLLAAMRSGKHRRFEAGQAEINPQTREMLQSLGYTN